MKKLFYIFCIMQIFLSGCAKKEPSTAISEATQKEIVVIQEDIKKSTCENKDSFIKRLDAIKTEVKNISLACNTEKEVLKEQVSKLKIIMVFLIVLVFLSIMTIIKRR